MRFSTPHRRAGRIVWATLVFMVGFTVLLVFISTAYLIPALDAANHATTDMQKRQLAAHARLLLAIILIILVAGIVLTFRFGRYFVPKVGEEMKPTKYVDAWAEAGKRVSVPPAENEDDEPEER